MQETFQPRLTALWAVFLCAAIAGCGGGSEEASTTPPPSAAPSPSAPPPHLPASAYLVEVGGEIKLCHFESDDDRCDDASATGIQDLVAIAIAGSTAYLASDTGPSAIFRCSIGPTGEVSECADTENSTPEAARALTVHGSTLYIAGSTSPRVRMCDIQADGSLGTCSDAGFPAASATDVQDIRIVGSTAYLLHNTAGRMSKCAVRENGTLFSCADANISGLDNALGFAVAGRYMYIAEFEAVTRCIVEPDGALTSCADAGVENVNAPSQVAVLGSSVYISDLNSNFGVVRCTAESDGLLTGCTKMYNVAAHSIVLK